MKVHVPESGDTLVGKYLLHRLLGRGGVGVVYEGEHLRLRQRVAIKILAPEMLANRDMIERFEREARAMALLQSPHVTRVTDVDFTPDGVPFLVMEFLQGNDLQHELKTRGALATAEAVYWVRQACVGMSVVHGAGIVHRDLKPANLFLVDGEPRTLKIMDFGISKIASEDFEMTTTQATLGTPAYMAPEQVRSARNIDVRADVWSLGVILYRALTGKLPFHGSGSTGMAVAIVNDPPTPIETLRPDLPPGLVAIVHRALAKTPEHRFPSVRALSDALAPFEAWTTAAPSLPSEATDAGPSVAGQSMYTPTPVKRRRAPILIGALATVVVVAGVTVAVFTRAPQAAAPAAEPETHEPRRKPTVSTTQPTPATPPSASPSVSPSASPSVSPSAPAKKAAPPPATPPAPKKTASPHPSASMPVLL